MEDVKIELQYATIEHLTKLSYDLNYESFDEVILFLISRYLIEEKRKWKKYKK